MKTIKAKMMAFILAAVMAVGLRGLAKLLVANF